MTDTENEHSPLSESVQRRLRALQFAGQSCSLFEYGTSNHEEAQAIFDSSFPVTWWGRVDWSRMINARCVREDDFSRRVGIVAQFLSMVDPDEEMYVSWTDGTSPFVRMRVASAFRHVVRMLEVD
jgi:hypothetical protein